MNFVALDIERLDNDQLSLCEIGMVKYENGVNVAEFHSYVKPRISLKRNIFGLNKLSRITDSMLLAADDFAVVYSKMKDFVNGFPLVCHNKGMDLNTIYHKEMECGVEGLYVDYFDTMDIFGGKKLEVIYEELFDKELRNHHYALDDARHTAEIFAFACGETDINQYIKSNYIPDKEKPKADVTKFQRVSLDGLEIEDDILEDFDFSGKTCVISGESPYRDLLKKELPNFCKKVTGSLSGSTNVFVVGEDVGPSKKTKAMELKAKNPESFFVFSQQNVALRLGLID